MALAPRLTPGWRRTRQAGQKLFDFGGWRGSTLLWSSGFGSAIARQIRDGRGRSRFRGAVGLDDSDDNAPGTGHGVQDRLDVRHRRASLNVFEIKPIVVAIGRRKPLLERVGVLHGLPFLQFA